MGGKTGKRENCFKILMCLVYCISVLMIGGIFNWSIAVLGVLIAGILFWANCTKGSFYKIDWKRLLEKNNRIYVLPFLLFGIQLLVTFVAVDKTAHLSGILQGVVLLLWIQLCITANQFLPERNNSPMEQHLFLELLPVLGTLMTFCGLAALIGGGLFPAIKSYFFTVGRFGGFFQYANTCGLFLLTGLVVAVRRKGKMLFLLPALFVGILMTGSRSVILLMLLWLLFYCFQSQKKKWLVFFLMLGAGGVLLVLYSVTGAGSQNFARIFTIFSSNSTFWGRLLYDWDGGRILLQNPLGLGYGGYYYVQHAYQSGVYTVRFAHNDILQSGLDYGFAFMVLFLIFFGWQFFKGRQSRLQKEVLALILVAALFDFHIQYLAISFLAVSCCDLYVPVKKQSKTDRTEYRILMAGLAIMCGILFVPYWSLSMGQYESTLKIMPNNTEALVMKMENTADRREAVQLADQILSQNRYLVEAYEIKAYAAASEGNLELMMENFDQVLRLEKYNVEKYKRYEQLLEDAIRQYYAAEVRDEANARKAQDKIDAIHLQLNALQETTSQLAYKIKDLPQFYW